MVIKCNTWPPADACKISIFEQLVPRKFFFMLVLLVEYIFFTTFYGLYFNHQLHITLKISSSSYMFHGDLLWAAFMYCIYTCLSDLWALPICIPCRLCSSHMILESSYKLTYDNHPDVLQSTSINRSGLFDGFSW